MEIESPQEHSDAGDSFRTFRRARDANLPGWFRDRQHAAWAQFESLPFPNRKDQPWRFSNVDALDLSRYTSTGQTEPNRAG